MSQRSLEALAQQTDHVAARLRRLAERAARPSAEMRTTFLALADLSALLREADAVLQMSLSAVAAVDLYEELEFLRPSLAWTLDDALNALTRDRHHSWTITWVVFADELEIEENMGFLPRIDLYCDFLRSQLDAVARFPHRSVRELRRRLARLKAAQEVNRLQADLNNTGVINTDCSRQYRTTRVTYSYPFQRRTSSTQQSPTFSPRPSPTFSPPRVALESRYNPPRRPPVPSPPPLSPAFTTTSSTTLSSTESAYSFNQPHGHPPALHWAHAIFDRVSPETPYEREHQLQDRSSCDGTNAPETLHSLPREGYIRVVEIPFDERRLFVRLYWRSLDERARIVIIARNSEGQNEVFGLPLQNLKFIRHKSAVQLCRPRHDGVYVQWAKLNFYSHEQMVLFYGTFLAMKLQDRHEQPRTDLIDRKELRSRNGGEIELFGGRIRHGNLVHALRIFKDELSGVVRLEAAALSGPRQDAPIWTAFVTRYAHDPDWACLEGTSTVSLIALRPPPFVFLSSYEPVSRDREYLLNFTTDEDAQDFVKCWTSICRSNS